MVASPSDPGPRRATAQRTDAPSSAGSARPKAARSRRPEAPNHKETPDQPPLAGVAIVALGIVYGDIGTSPLYAFRESFLGHGAPLAATPTNVLGILSLIFWALIVVISIKYLLLVMRADNRGEGGIIALVSLLTPRDAKRGSFRYALISLGLFGAALLYGDGTITPAISVLSAIEGLNVATPAFQAFIIPITVAILVGLFAVQRRGTAAIGAIFGPIMLFWFVVLAALGIGSIVREPGVLAALSPLHAFVFFGAHGWVAFLVLGTVFLAVTGGEALYADMGHFGPRPIRVAWFSVVLPALVLNYFGQGALVLSDPSRIGQPFYHLAPDWALYPLVLLATTATVIASQSVISGVFSLTRQAVQLNLLPRLNIVQTHGGEKGQIYIPSVNWLLMIATIGLVLGFRSSGNLASAYGVAISTDMVITTVLAFFVARRWGWNVPAIALLAAAFLVVDLAFFGANLVKIAEGGWYPLLVGGIIFTLISTWRSGRRVVAAQLHAGQQTLEELVQSLRHAPPVRVPGTAVFMTSAGATIPPILLHHLRHNQALHEQVVLVYVETEDVPRVPAAERLEVYCLDRGLYRVALRYGFMQTPNIPVALRLCEALGLRVDLDTTTFYLGRETLIPRKDIGLPLWRDHIFDFMSRNAARATAFYRIPPDHVVELGIQVEI
ncbi:MAG: potassium transporter Kup [Geminicoccaceae bacterium]